MTVADEALVRTIATQREQLVAMQDERDRLREALVAYRSALRSGESETERLRALGDEALSRPEAKSRIPDGFCPVCTKDLEADGWCFECRKFVSRLENERG